MPLILGIETSCDECSASVVRCKPGQPWVEVLGIATFSQVQIHRPYGGVVPEVASRNHLETINAMIEQALGSPAQGKINLGDLDAIAVSNRPGLVGALLVGVSAAKALAYALGKPLIPVHHLEGHAASVFIEPPETVAGGNLPMPLLIAVISGGHTNLYVAQDMPERWPIDFLKKALVGRSRDDAAGEAFDKTAKLLGFPYPGGIWIEKTSKGGNAAAFSFPRAMNRKNSLDFSFSGLKTAVALEVANFKSKGALANHLPDLCASIQEAIVDALLNKIFLAVEKYACGSLAVVGGVAANKRLRSRLDSEWKSHGLRIPPLYPKLEYCTDNGAMIAAAGAFRFAQGQVLTGHELLTLNAIANPES